VVFRYSGYYGCGTARDIHSISLRSGSLITKNGNVEFSFLEYNSFPCGAGV